MCGFGLINMNGRLYDPYLQRFLSPDPYVQAPGNAQNYNRYSYCLNNPLMFTDPSGEFIWFVPVIVGAVIGAYVGASIQSGTAAFWDWKPDAWKGAIIGGIVGAGAGLGFSALFGPGVLGTPGGFMAQGMFTAAGKSTLAYSMTSQALIWGNVNMGLSALGGGDVNDVMISGIKGLAAGAAMGYANTVWNPKTFGGYMLKRNAINNIMSLSSEEEYFKLSFGPVAWNSKDGFSHLFQKDLSLFERLGMVYETAGMMKFLPPSINVKSHVWTPKQCGWGWNPDERVYGLTSIKKTAATIFGYLDPFYGNQINGFRIDKTFIALHNYSSPIIQRYINLNSQ
jgi:RHS repeat-associated protein